MPRRKMIEVSQHNTSGYRAGCKCTQCRAAHTDDAQARRHQARYGEGGPMSPAVRGEIIRAVRAGASVADAAKKLGITHQQVYGAASALPDFGDELERHLS